MPRPRIPASTIADEFRLVREVAPPEDFVLHKGKQIYRSRQWQAEKVTLLDDTIEWRLFWKGIHVCQVHKDMAGTELRNWLITEIDELFEE